MDGQPNSCCCVFRRSEENLILGTSTDRTSSSETAEERINEGNDFAEFSQFKEMLEMQRCFFTLNGRPDNRERLSCLFIIANVNVDLFLHQCLSRDCGVGHSAFGPASY